MKMKCVLCNGQCTEKMVEHTELGVSLGMFKALVCSQCGEAFFDSATAEKIQAKSKGMGLFGLAAKKTKVAKVGNSLAVRIPKEVADFVKLKKEKVIKVTPKSKKEILLEVM